MSVRAALLLGVSLVVAALLHGGIYTAGHDFVLNRFTGAWVFVPAEDAGDEEMEALTPSAWRARATRTLTSPTPGVRVARSSALRGASHATRAGR